MIQISRFNMTNYWFISDTHFNHENILKFLDTDGSHQREFEDIEQMNELMIENWNKLIKPEDKVYHLGDVIFGSPKKFDEVLSRLNGKKRLILGNHDAGKERFLAPYFQKMQGARHLNIKGFKCVLSHIPLHEGSIERHGNLNIHGHLHSNECQILHVPSLQRVKDKRYINVCVEQTDYKPINLDTILAY